MGITRSGLFHISVAGVVDVVGIESRAGGNGSGRMAMITVATGGGGDIVTVVTKSVTRFQGIAAAVVNLFYRQLFGIYQQSCA